MSTSLAGRKPFMFALAGNVVTSFDITNKTITVDPSELVGGGGV